MFFKFIQFGFNLLAKKYDTKKVKIEVEKMQKEIKEKHKIEE